MSDVFYYAILLVMTIMGAFAAFFLKKTSALGTKNILFNRNFYFGAALYFFSALLNIYVLKFLDYSEVLPLTALTYIWTMLLAGKLLNERITLRKKWGIFFILFGAICLVLK